MSASDRFAKDAERREKRFAEDAKEGLRELLEGRNGQTWFWMLWTTLMDPHHKDAAIRMPIGLDLMKSAQIANWSGVQIMREEHEAPRSPSERPPELTEDE